MRLTCPNCDAQYEVPDEVIPTAGRDVQCSNCGKTWYQHHPDHMPEEAVADVTAPDPDEEIAPPPPPTPSQQPAPARKELDPGVADILRQEAEAERQARRRAADALESQPDLGLGDESDGHDGNLTSGDQPQDTQEAARARMARMRGEDPEVSNADATAAAISSRRDLLPDIDEINSTLRSSSDGSSQAQHADLEIDAPTYQRNRMGFRTGFLVMLLMLVFGLLLYVFASDLASAVPSLDGALSKYVNWVDRLRLWLDGQMQALLAALDAMASQSSGGGAAT